MNNINLTFLFQKPDNSIVLEDKELWLFNQAALSNNKQHLATYHSYRDKKIHQKVKIWDLVTKKQRKKIELKSNQQLVDLEFSSDNHFLFITLPQQINIIDLLSKQMASKIIKLKLTISRIAFNPTYQEAITVYEQENYFTIWNISSMKKIVDKHSQNIIRNAKFLGLKNFLTISVEDDEYTHYQVWNSQKLRIVRQWKGKYVSGDMKLYLGNSDTLIVDFRDEYQHYIQIWNLINANLIKTLFSEIEDFAIKNILGFKLVVEGESDDEDDDEDLSIDSFQVTFAAIRIYDLLTCRQKQMPYYIGKNNDYKILASAIVEQRVFKKNSELIVYLQ